MAQIINEECNACNACVDICPNQAISAATPIYIIDPLRCTECVGAQDEPQCQLLCPVGCIVDHPDFRESHEQLLAKYEALKA